MHAKDKGGKNYILAANMHKTRITQDILIEMLFFYLLHIFISLHISGM